MAKKVYDMDPKERYEFEDQLTFHQLDNLDEQEVLMLDREVIHEVVLDTEFYDIEDAIHYKEQFDIELTEVEENYLHWGNEVDSDLGPPIMDSETFTDFY